MFPQITYQLITWEKTVILQWRNMAHIVLTRWSEWSPVKGQVDICLMWYSGKNKTSFIPARNAYPVVFKKIKKWKTKKCWRAVSDRSGRKCDIGSWVEGREDCHEWHHKTIGRIRKWTIYSIVNRYCVLDCDICSLCYLLSLFLGNTQWRVCGKVHETFAERSQTFGMFAEGVERSSKSDPVVTCDTSGGSLRVSRTALATVLQICDKKGF